MRDGDDGARWMTLEAIAERAGRELIAGRRFNRKTLTRWITQGMGGRTLAARKVGGRYVTTLEALEEFLGLEGEDGEGSGIRHQGAGGKRRGDSGISDAGLSERLARAGLSSSAAGRR